MCSACNPQRPYLEFPCLQPRGLFAIWRISSEIFFLVFSFSFFLFYQISLNSFSFVLLITDVRLVKFKIKPGKKTEWIAWCRENEKRKTEVVATLKNEGVVSESWWSDANGFAYCFIEAHDLKKAKESVQKNPHPIDKEHRVKREVCLEKVYELVCLVHTENHD